MHDETRSVTRLAASVGARQGRRASISNRYRTPLESSKFSAKHRVLTHESPALNRVLTGGAER
jgi:hypothetical protein